MKQTASTFFIVSALLLLTLLAAGCSTSSTPGDPAPQGPAPRYVAYVTVSNGFGTAGNIVALGFDPDTGDLTPVSGGETASGYTPVAVAVDPAHQYLYTANNDGSNGSLSQYRINDDRTLTRLADDVATTAGVLPSDLVVTHDGGFVFTTNWDITDCVSRYPVGADGSLGAGTDIATGVLATGSPSALAMHPTDDVLYISLRSTSQVGAWVYDASGNISLSGSTQNSDSNPEDIVVDPGGDYVYSANFNGSSTTGFTIDASDDSVSSIILTSSYGSTSSWHTLDMDPTGSYLYVGTTQSSSNIIPFSIDSSTGEMLSLATPYSASLGHNCVKVDPTGSYLLTLSSGSKKAYRFTIGADGSLATPAAEIDLSGYGSAPLSFIIVDFGP